MHNTTPIHIVGSKKRCRTRARTNSERNVVVGAAEFIGRHLVGEVAGSRGSSTTTSTAAASTTTTATTVAATTTTATAFTTTTTTAAQEQNVGGVDFRGGALVAVFVVPLTRLNSTFHANASALAQDFVECLSAVAPHNDCVPLGSLLTLARFVQVRLGRRDAQTKDSLTPLGVLELGIHPEVANEDRFVETFRHVASLVNSMNKEGETLPSRRPFDQRDERASFGLTKSTPTQRYFARFRGCL